MAGATGILFIILRAGRYFLFWGFSLGIFRLRGELNGGDFGDSRHSHARRNRGERQASQIDPTASISVVPLAVPLIVGPATMTTSLLLVSTYSGPYNEMLGKPWGQFAVIGMVWRGLVANLAILFLTAMYHSNHGWRRWMGKNTMEVINRDRDEILLTAIAVSLIRQGIMSIVAQLPPHH